MINPKTPCTKVLFDHKKEAPAGKQKRLLTKTESVIETLETWMHEKSKSNAGHQ
jgi:hypothetical protein